jgi:hypothetical protein
VLETSSSPLVLEQTHSKKLNDLRNSLLSWFHKFPLLKVLFQCLAQRSHSIALKRNSMPLKLSFKSREITIAANVGQQTARGNTQTGKRSDPVSLLFSRLNTGCKLRLRDTSR